MNFGKTKKKISQIMKRGLLYALTFIMGNLAIIIYSNWRIESTAGKDIYNNIKDLPKNKVGLVLGTTKYITRGVLNPYFVYRIEAAVELYKAGKIEYILVSGDNSEIFYNEPITMKKELISYGIPEEAIFLDFAGFRTLDSVIRCKEVFGQDQFTIISQQFQNLRAVYIAQNANINAIAYNSKDVGLFFGIKTQARELFARVNAIIDVHILHKRPKFLGQKVNITN